MTRDIPDEMSDGPKPTDCGPWVKRPSSAQSPTGRSPWAWGALFILFCCSGVHGQDRVHDFTGSCSKPKLIYYSGTDAKEYVTPENEGLRIRFGPPQAPTRPVGVAWHYWVRGDFIATVSYEILEVDRPEKGDGVGVELYLYMDNPA